MCLICGARFEMLMDGGRDSFFRGIGAVEFSEMGVQRGGFGVVSDLRWTAGPESFSYPEIVWSIDVLYSL